MLFLGKYILKMPKRGRDYTAVEMPPLTRRRTGFLRQFPLEYFKHAPVVAGAAAVGSQWLYNKVATRENAARLVRQVTSSPAAMNAVYQAIRVANPKLARETDSWREERMLRGNRTSQTISHPRGSWSRAEGPVVPAVYKKQDKMRPKSREDELEVDEPVLVEAQNGRQYKIDVRTYGHDADDLGDLRGSGVYVNGAEVTKSTLSGLSTVAGRPLINDDGDGAVLVKLPSGKVVWQVGVLRYPVQYMGKKICPFSFSSGRYSQVVPSVNVIR